MSGQTPYARPATTRRVHLWHCGHVAGRPRLTLDEVQAVAAVHSPPIPRCCGAAPHQWLKREHPELVQEEGGS